MREPLSIFIVHRLHGRLRLRLSIAPHNPDEFCADVKDHEGIESVEFTHVTRSLLIRYAGPSIRHQELLVRVALRLSVDYGLAPVRISTTPNPRELSDSALWAGAAIALALAARLGQQTPPPYLDLGAGALTGFAVAEHGWTEFNETGTFDPELISFVYLLNAMARGAVMPAALLTWAASFGRHVIWPATESIELRPTRISQNESGRPQYELVIQNDRLPDDRMKQVGRFVRAAIQSLTNGKADAPNTLLEQIQEISHLHGQIFEGLGGASSGIPVHIR